MVINIVIAVAVAAVVLWFLWISRSNGDADNKTLAYRFHLAWRRFAFWAGDVKFGWQWYFGLLPLPHFSWVQHEYRVSPEDLLGACKLLKGGDIMLATKDGYVFSNAAIPGCFKHAGIITHAGSDVALHQLVEAVSEGVVERHPLHARADLMIFVRPKHMHDSERIEAVKTARNLVGCAYDSDFEFDIEKELSLLNQQMSSDVDKEDTSELSRLKINMQGGYDIAFSCTEVVATAWWFRRRQLGIARKRVRGRFCIVADQFVNRDFTIVWTNVSESEAEKRGLHEEGVRELAAYWGKEKGVGSNQEQLEKHVAAGEGGQRDGAQAPEQLGQAKSE